MLQELIDESRHMKLNIANVMVIIVYNTTINVNNVLIENIEGYGGIHMGNTTASRKMTRTKRYNEESWQDIFKHIAICLKRHMCNAFMLPAMT